jgi:hypothetical protein
MKLILFISDNSILLAYVPTPCLYGPQRMLVSFTEDAFSHNLFVFYLHLLTFSSRNLSSALSKNDLKSF